MRNALTLLWPTTTKSGPTLLGRLGRIMHWSLTLFAILTAILGISYLNTASSIDLSAPAPAGWESGQQIATWYSEQGTKWVFFAIGAFFAGRASRYVLSAE